MRIGLVGCVKKKQAMAVPAEDLYISPLFRGRRGFVESSCDRWLILSAKHGLVDPKDVLDPYDETLRDKPVAARRSWANQVVADLAKRFPDLAEVTFEIHAGAAYVEHGLVSELKRRGARIELPVAGLTQGQQLAFYASRRKALSPVSSDLHVREVTVPEQIVELAVAQLLDENSAEPASGFPRDRQWVSKPGLYSWWCDSRGSAEMALGMGFVILTPLIYCGQAGAGTSSATLLSRLRSNHIGGNIRASTFRWTLASILRGPLQLDVIGPKVISSESEGKLTDWIKTHLSVATYPHADRIGLRDLENHVLQRLRPPLNLAKLERHDLQRRVSELRARLASGES